MNNILIEIGRLLALAKGRVGLLFPAQVMLRIHVPTVHVGKKWLLEVLHVDSAATLRADFLLASEVNTEETRHRYQTPQILTPNCKACSVLNGIERFGVIVRTQQGE